ncbi:MAG: phosphate/phosphite/phosphonate ABC transporter substrate-binding protein [Sulfitobacter sp.]
MIASLMMYMRPELDAAHARYWDLVRIELAARGVAAPVSLSNDADEFEVWNAPDLVLSQTCGMPYRTWLHDRVTLIGTPDFGVPDCPPGYYNSAIVVRADDTRATLPAFKDARFTYNQTFSQSGYAAAYALTKPLGFWFENRLQSHGHLNSARAVAEGRADIAALDAVSWRLIAKYEPFAGDLRVLEWTAPTPGLPYIAAASADKSATFEAVSAAIAALDDADRDALGIRELVAIPKVAYLAIENPPDSAS